MSHSLISPSTLPEIAAAGAAYTATKQATTFPGKNGRIVFWSDRHELPSLFSMQADGAGQLRLTAEQAYEQVPAVSPDGARIASLKGFEGSVHGLAWHPKNGQLAVSGFDGKVYFYSLPEGKLLSSFTPVPMAAPKRGAMWHYQWNSLRNGTIWRHVGHTRLGGIVGSPAVALRDE